MTSRSQPGWGREFDGTDDECRKRQSSDIVHASISLNPDVAMATFPRVERAALISPALRVITMYRSFRAFGLAFGFLRYLMARDWRPSACRKQALSVERLAKFEKELADLKEERGLLTVHWQRVSPLVRLECVVINADWHRRYPMLMGSTLSQRVQWHVAHAKACGCRPVPPTVLKELRRLGRKPPQRRAGSTRARRPA